MTKMACPNCGRVGTSSKMIPNGAKVRCAGCKILFVYRYEPMVDEEHDVDAILAAAAEKKASRDESALDEEHDVDAILAAAMKKQAGRATPFVVKDASNPPANEVASQQTTKQCFYCGEDILAIAKKCKHCGEFLDDSLRQSKSSISIHNVNSVHGKIDSTSGASVSHPGIAALLSLLIPGAGQMYRGRVGSGIAWLICTVIGYMFFIVPGLILHLICIVTAASDNK